MANKHIQKAFDPTKSATSLKLMNMSDEEIFQRYFKKDNGIDWVSDFEDEINRRDKDKKDVYPRIVTFLGQPLDVICSIINNFIYEYLPGEYKLNSKAFAQDLENILLENTKFSRETASTAETNEFTVQVATFFKKMINKGIDYTDSLTASN